MKNRIITVSREFGSGGRTIAKKVGEKLGIPCYDYEIIRKIAEKSGFAEEFIKERGEYAASKNKFLEILSGRDFYGHSIQDELNMVQTKVINELAEEGPCVIVGRCADYILRDSADLLTVFIHADMAKRAERIVKLYGERTQTPEQRLKDKDAKRRAYYLAHTDTEWGIAKNYHVSLDSGVIGIDKCVEIITALY